MAKYTASRTYEIEIENSERVEQVLEGVGVSFASLLDEIASCIDMGDLNGYIDLIRGTVIGEIDQVAYWWDADGIDESEELKTIISVGYQGEAVSFKIS